MSIRYIAFSPSHPGTLLPQQIVDNLIALAQRGYVGGRDIRLVPDKRFGRPDASGFRQMRSVKKNECIWLSSLCPK